MPQQNQPTQLPRSSAVAKPQQLAHRIVKFTALGGGAFSQALGPNSQRQAIVIACMIVAGAAQQVDVSTSTSVEDFIASQASPFVLTLTLQLYGPIIQQPIFLRSLAVGDRVNVIETYLLP
jgi:hypothetical protein